MKTLRNLSVGSIPLFASGVALAQSGSMMSGDGSMWGFAGMGGYGGIWLPILVVVAVAAVVALVVQRRGK